MNVMISFCELVLVTLVRALALSRNTASALASALSGQRARMNTCKQAHAITVVVVLVMGCERARPASARSDSSVVPFAAKPALGLMAAEGSFAYVDSGGTQLLALDSLQDPSTIIGALCSRGIALPVRYERRMTRQSNDNGRQVASNFRNQQGDVFRVVGMKATPDKTCYLSPDSALLANARAATMREPADCSPEQVARIEGAKGRRVIHCWDIATASTHREVLAVQFIGIDSSALASLAIVGDSSVLFKDFPAVQHAGDQSTWRVDDEGVFSPSGFDILFVAALPYGYVMAITWAGAEGESSELLLADSASAFRTLAKAYRYWSPA